MAKVLIVYCTRTGNTEEMAKAIEQGAKTVGAEVVRKKATEVEPADFLDCGAVAFGSPTNFGYMAGALKEIFDSILHNIRKQVVGLPYATFGSGQRGTAKVLEVIEGICQSLQLKKTGEGVIATGKPSAEVLAQCQELGKKLGNI